MTQTETRHPREEGEAGPWLGAQVLAPRSKYHLYLPRWVPGLLPLKESRVTQAGPCPLGDYREVKGPPVKGQGMEEGALWSRGLG